MLYSPVFHIASVLSVALVILSIYMATFHDVPVPVGLWLLAATLIIALLVLRRWLKRRFPY